MASFDEAGVFRAARDFLLLNREDYRTAYEKFQWPQLTEFNWALDWFDALAQEENGPALWIVEEDGGEQRFSFADLSRRSNQVASWLRQHGVRRGDRVIVMLGNQIELWETVLAVVKLGAVMIPATPLLQPADLRDRIDRGHARHVMVGSDDVGKFAGIAGDFTRIAVGETVHDWLPYGQVYDADPAFVPDGRTRADDPLLLYFTSGTTAQPKLVEHTHASYPVGHLSTMYWIGLRPGDVHLNISSPGWAKHAWSNVFAPWNAAACVFIYNYARFDASRLMAEMDRCGVTSFCAPPTVWRMLIQADLGQLRMPPREVVSAGEPLKSGDHRPSSPGLGRHDPRRLRPDRDDRSDRQYSGSGGQARVDGSAGTGLCRRAHRSHDWWAGRRGRDLSRLVPAAARPHGRVPG